MDDRWTSLLFFFLLILLSHNFQNCSVSGLEKWAKNDLKLTTTRGNSVMSFRNIYYPRDIFYRLPVLRNYPLIFPHIDSPLYDICDMSTWSDMFNQVQHTAGDDSILRDFIISQDCHNLFCTNNSQNNGFHSMHDWWSNMNETAKVIYTAKSNYCYFCISNQSNVNVQQFIQFHNAIENGTCHWLIPYHFDHCGGNQTGYPLIDANLVGNLEQNPYICYCKHWNKYGYMCDLYTLFLNDLNMYGKNWIFIIFGSMECLLSLIIVLIPVIHDTFSDYKKNGSKVKELSNFLGLRMQSTIFTCTAQVFFVFEQIWSLVERFSLFSFLPHHFLYGGVFRILSLSSIAFAYSSMLVLWAKTVNRIRTISTGFDTKVIMLLVGFYLSLILLGIAVTIMTALRVYPQIIYSVASAYGLIYFLLFPTGFGILGLFMFAILRKANQNIKEYKITRFMLIMNTTSIIGFIILLLLAVGYIFGWDYMGTFMGTYRNIFLDTMIALLFIPMMYILSNKKSIGKIYGGIFSRLRIKFKKSSSQEGTNALDERLVSPEYHDKASV